MTKEVCAITDSSHFKQDTFSKSGYPLFVVLQPRSRAKAYFKHSKKYFTNATQLKKSGNQPNPPQKVLV
jgi:hypothetical protein